MRTLTPAEITALGQRAVAFRNLVWLSAKDRNTGVVNSLGFWDDVGTTQVQVTDAFTGLPVLRTFVGAASLLQIDDITMTSDLSVQEVAVRLSSIDATVAQAVRGYDARLAPIQIYRLILNPASGVAAAPGRARFVGVVDTLEITDPAEGNEGSVTLNCVNQLRELTRSNPDMASDESQKLRSSDRFYQYSNDVTRWQVSWGEKRTSIRKKNKKS